MRDVDLEGLLKTRLLPVGVLIAYIAWAAESVEEMESLIRKAREVYENQP